MRRIRFASRANARRVVGMWKPISVLPKQAVPLIIRGRSGYVPPNDIFVSTGYYYPDWRPLEPWRDEQGNAFDDFARTPIEWMYRYEFEALVFANSMSRVGKCEGQFVKKGT